MSRYAGKAVAAAGRRLRAEDTGELSSAVGGGDLIAGADVAESGPSERTLQAAEMFRQEMASSLFASRSAIATAPASRGACSALCGGGQTTKAQRCETAGCPTAATEKGPCWHPQVDKRVDAGGSARKDLPEQGGTPQAQEAIENVVKVLSFCCKF